MALSPSTSITTDRRGDPRVRPALQRVARALSRPRPSSDAAELLASGLVGAAGHSAQFWLTNGRRTPKAEAEALVAALIWRGIASFPLQGGASGGTPAEIG